MHCGSFLRRSLFLLALAFALHAGLARAQSPAQRVQALAEVPDLVPGAAAFHRTPARATPLPRRDSWFGFDKVQHVTFSFLFTVGSQYTLVNKADVSETNALPASIGISAGIGLAKELRDSRPGGTGFSYKDLVWDAAGIACASLLIAL